MERRVIKVPFVRALKRDRSSWSALSRVRLPNAFASLTRAPGGVANVRKATARGSCESSSRNSPLTTWPTRSVANSLRSEELRTGSRGVLDGAADADPDTGYSVVVDGTSTVIGGTSAATPPWAALFARPSQALGKPLGYVNPLLYSPSLSSGFREITRGNNDGYSVGLGWNPCTGLGPPEGSKLLSDLGP